MGKKALEKPLVGGLILRASSWRNTEETTGAPDTSTGFLQQNQKCKKENPERVF
jgi:hypothetical protein